MELPDNSGGHEARAETGMLSCEVCMKEIPASEASSSEATDYVIYFFGIECYGIWIKNRQLMPDAPPSS
jgi:hypothetical protein